MGACKVVGRSGRGNFLGPIQWWAGTLGANNGMHLPECY
jgi:hypothetical protein